MTNLLPDRAPPWWPRFQSRLRSRALTARIGRVLGISFGICFVTGMLSHYQYQPWSFLPEPSAPVWGYRLTQGLHVLTGVLTIPLLLLKLWSVYPRLFTWPPVAGARNALERLSIAVLVSSALVELTTGFFNALDWYPWPWSFVPVHRFLGYVVIGSILLHVSIKLPDIRAGLRTRLAADDPPSDDLASATPAEPPAAGLTRRGLLTAVGAGIGGLGLVMAGQTVTPLSRVGLFAIRREQDAPQESLPVNRTAEQAAVAPLATDPGWSLQLRGPAGEMSLPLGRVERMVGAARPGRVLAHRLRRGLERGRRLARAPAAGSRRAGRRGPELPRPRRLAGAAGLLQGELRRGSAAGRGAARHAPERQAPDPRPRLPAPADRPGPRRGAEHQVAQPGGGALDADADRPRRRRCPARPVRRLPAAHPGGAR